jgi:N-acetylmuramoyl-L-alanine amidase
LSKIFIDPGHGGNDPGAVHLQYHESVVNLAVGLKLKYWLEQAGHTVKMSRETDCQTSLPGICEESNHWGANFFISLHCNSFNDEYPTGIETWYYGQYNAAKTMQDTLVGHFLRHLDRGTKKGTLYVLKNTVAPALLVEMEFISNPTMAEWLYKTATQDELAWVISGALETILGVF